MCLSWYVLTEQVRLYTYSEPTDQFPISSDIAVLYKFPTTHRSIDYGNRIYIRTYIDIKEPMGSLAETTPNTYSTQSCFVRSCFTKFVLKVILLRSCTALVYPQQNTDMFSPSSGQRNSIHVIRMGVNCGVPGDTG